MLLGIGVLVVSLCEQGIEGALVGLGFGSQNTCLEVSRLIVSHLTLLRLLYVPLGLPMMLLNPRQL